jgi:hypothetical protein
MGMNMNSTMSGRLLLVLTMLGIFVAVSVAQQEPRLQLPWYEAGRHATLFGEVVAIQGVWLDQVDPSHALPWQGPAGLPAATFTITQSYPPYGYGEWHNLIIKGVAMFYPLAPGLSLTGILAEYDPIDNTACLLEYVMDVDWGDYVGPTTPYPNDAEKRNFTIYFRFAINAGSIFGGDAWLRALLSDQQAEPTLREGSTADPAELIIFLGDWILPGAGGGWTWWSVSS